MKSLKIFSMIFALLCIFAITTTGTVSAISSPAVSFDGSHTWTVRPLNRTPDDAQNIQRAIDRASPGDTVKLGAGVFNFGDFDSVGITKDLTLEGAWDPAHKVPLTTIQGGFTPVVIGGYNPAEKPGTMTVNGRAVIHITKEPSGQFYFPFLYPPYFDQDTLQVTQPYRVKDHWTKVIVNVRQITFVRPYLVALYASGMGGGVIERCRFISAWPMYMGWWDMNDTLGIGSIQWWNQQGSYGWASGNFELPDAVFNYDLVEGSIVERDNVIISDYGEVALGAKDAWGKVAVTPFDGHSAPPGNDYGSYVVQDLYDGTVMWNMHPENSPAQYWVRKGYTVQWIWINGEPQVYAVRGQIFGVHTHGTQMNLTFQNNTVLNEWISFNDASPNGQWGTPLTLNVIGNTIISNLKSSRFDGATGILIADWYGGSPGTNAFVRDNNIAINFTGQNNVPGNWTMGGIDIEVQGQVEVTGNTVAMNSETGIALWGPVQNGLVENNTILGKGDYAFATYWSSGNRFINNRVSAFLPTGQGAYDRWGEGWPPYAVPVARGVLYSADGNTVQGTGTPGPLDYLYDCGADNVVTNMTVRACPAAPEAPSMAPAALSAAGDGTLTPQVSPNARLWKNYLLPVR